LGKFVLSQNIYFFHKRTFDDEQPFPHFKSFPAAKESAELSLLYIQRPIFELLTADKDEIKNNFDFVEQLFYSWNIKYSKDEAL